MLQYFYAEVRQKDGTMYSRSTMCGMRAGIQRYLQGPPLYKNINIINNPIFSKSNKVFVAMLKKLKADGLDTTSHYPPISDADMQKISQDNAFNLDNATELQEKVWFDISLHFARRGRENLRKLTPQSFVFKTDDIGKEYVEMAYHEKTKNHPGTVNDMHFSKPRMYQNGKSNCPVNSLKLYLQCRNQETSDFFQLPAKKQSPPTYTKKPSGVNTIGNFMKNISTRLGLSRKYTNHSVRSSTATFLSHAGVETNEIMKITGHKNYQSLLSYNSDSSDAQKRQYSGILQRSENVNTSSTSARAPSIVTDTSSIDTVPDTRSSQNSYSLNNTLSKFNNQSNSTHPIFNFHNCSNVHIHFKNE